MDNKTTNQSTAQLELNSVKMETHRCNTCDKLFSTEASLRRHTASFHDQERLKFQCWNCPKSYARKESVLTHSRKLHNDTEHKFAIVRTTNTRYKPEIFITDPWTPPPEACTRTNGMIYQVQIQLRHQFQPSRLRHQNQIGNC